MAKKQSAATDFKMSDAIKTVLGENPKFTGKEALDAIKSKYPDATINEKSFGVAFYNTRKKLGIASKRRGGATKKVVRKMPSVTARPSMDMASLQLAVKFIAEIGDAETAIAAIKQVQGLQISSAVPF